MSTAVLAAISKTVRTYLITCLCYADVVCVDTSQEKRS